jgi:peptide/nickel transport system substrate-binding protein
MLIRALQSGKVSRRQFIQSAGAAGLTLTSGSALLAACQQAGPTPQGGQPKRGGTLTVGVTAPTYPIDPFKSGDPGSRTTFVPVINHLVRVTPDLRILPQLATEWSSVDARVWTVKLRQGVKFHNGKDFKADDVVATYDRLVDSATGSSAVSTFRSFLQKGGTTKVDDFTVRFELTRPVADFPYSLFTYQAAILPADFSGDFASSPIGTGPFKLTNYVPKQSAELVRNENYWEKGFPYLDKVKLVYFSDPGAEVTAIQSGTIDILQDVPLDTIDTLKSSGGVQLLSASSGSHAQLAMRVDTKPFDDKRVRQAIALSLDREKIVRNLWSGFADIGNDHLIAPIYPLSKNVTVPQRKQDYERAKKLLADAGYPSGIDVELRTHSIFGLQNYAQAVQDMAKPANIRIKLTVEPDDTYYEHWNTFPFALEAWIHRPSPSQLMNLAYRCGGSWNVPHLCNTQFDSLVTQFDAELDQAKRGDIANKIATLMNDETPAIISFFYKTTKAVRNRVQGQDAEPTDYLDLRRTWVQ